MLKKWKVNKYFSSSWTFSNLILLGKKYRNQFWQIFSHFQAIWNNIDLFYFLTTFFSGHPVFWGEVKKSKNHFLPIFSPFQAILNNFDFSHCRPNFDCPPFYLFLFFLGGYPKLNLVIYNWMYTHNFNLLLCLEHVKKFVVHAVWCGVVRCSAV